MTDPDDPHRPANSPPPPDPNPYAAPAPADPGPYPAPAPDPGPYPAPDPGPYAAPTPAPGSFAAPDSSPPAASPPAPSPYPAADPNPYAAQPPGDPFAAPAYPPVSGTPATFQYPTVSGTAPLPVVYPPVSGPVSYPPALVSGPGGYAQGYGQGYGQGYDPYTGQPLSDKSKIVAGLLQLLPGFMLGLGGIGRLYAGQTALGVTQLVLTVFGWISFWCGFLLLFPFFIYAGLWIWFVVDGIVLMAGRPVDGQGRLLKT